MFWKSFKEGFAWQSGRLASLLVDAAGLVAALYVIGRLLHWDR